MNSKRIYYCIDKRQNSFDRCGQCIASGNVFYQTGVTGCDRARRDNKRTNDESRLARQSHPVRGQICSQPTIDLQLF